MTQIEFPQERAMLADIASRFFREKSPMETVRELIPTESGYREDVFAEMVEAGWLGMAIPESHGGDGLSLADVAVLSEAMGRRLFASPFLSTQIAAQALLAGASPEQQEEWLPRIARGERATLAVFEDQGSWSLTEPSAQGTLAKGTCVLSGRKSFVADAPQAALWIVSVRIDGELGLALVAPTEEQTASLERESIVDETRRSYRLRLEGASVPESALLRGPCAERAVEASWRAALLLLTAEACGGTAGALDLVVDYLKTRIQFDRPIGSYQALKHPTVDVLIGLERSRSHLYHAATVVESGESEVALRMAKAQSSDAFAFAGDRAIQFHGGFGFTYECDAQLFLRRALWCQYQFGDSLHHRRALADLVL